MASGNPRSEGVASPPTIPPAALEAVAAPRPAEAPRRCFICLTDEEPTDSPNSWVDPCPCTLEAHQDCMLSWVTDCERSNKPLQCPVCKSRITLEGPWDPIVALSDAVSRKFTRASPFMLLTSVSVGIQFSLQMYGAMAMWTFSGRDALLQFMLGPEMMIDGRSVRGIRLAKERLGNALILMNIGPALLLGQMAPWLGNKIFLPVASLYGMYQVMHDDYFLTWPPSPQLAIAVFPYIRSAYYNLWKEFVFPYEVSLNRRILGLPPLEEQQNNRPANNRRGGQRNEGGGIMNFLMGVLDALDPDDDDEQADGAREIRIGGGDDNNDGEGHDEVVVELVIEEFPADEQEIEEELARIEREEGWRPVEQQAEPANPPADRPANQQAEQPEHPHQDAEQEPAAAPANELGEQHQHNHEVPQAPPARRPGLGSILSSVSNAIVSALILPGISFTVGELLRLALPKSWTGTSPRNPWYRPGIFPRPGLLQQQWGRSLLGGCLYIVMKDALRLYTKYRKVSNMDKRKVKNVERRRGGSNN